MKKALYSLGIVVALLILFFALTALVSLGDQDDSEMSDVEAHFYERMITIGFGEMMPIEGFDAELLMSVYPGLEPSDFEGVEAFEGYYVVEDGEVVFVRDQERPVSSAERTISEEGYATLLNNVSARLDVFVTSETDVDALIKEINTADTVRVGVDEEASAFGVTVTPHEVLEDSRCPVGTECVQAGTVRVRATLESGLGTADQVFELGEPITTEAETVTLVQALPEQTAGEPINTSEYVFYFEVAKR